ncbi:MAG: hypothetical protein ACLS8J_05855 [Streptococcus salivarius]
MNGVTERWAITGTTWISTYDLENLATIPVLTGFGVSPRRYPTL